MQSVSFRGDGYVELTSQPLRSESSFGFSFRTLASEGLLLLSTFQGQANGDLVNLVIKNLQQNINSLKLFLFKLECQTVQVLSDSYFLTCHNKSLDLTLIVVTPILS